MTDRWPFVLGMREGPELQKHVGKDSLCSGWKWYLMNNFGFHSSSPGRHSNLASVLAESLPRQRGRDGEPLFWDSDAWG